ncbi:hypothetical protein [Winslowiella toletana]|uniref:hypothetical protein n=1 Tax=Winslowiella toletana TaxID=92490 RepID=UPI0028BF4053|nr:hypothetical protein [Winslowiella toletana]WNN46700.1 hypothetical protein RIN69_22490 [Winslowiella toletana]
MKQPMRFSDAVRTCSLALAATGIVLAAALMVSQAQASVPLADNGVTLVSLSVSNPQPYLAHDWDSEAGNKNGRSSAVFPFAPDKSGQMKELAPATMPPNSETVYSEPLSCHPGCKRA